VASTALLTTRGQEKIKRWIEAGGTLIALGKSAAFLAEEDRGISSVRLRRNVLKCLSVYKESVQRERDARNIKIDTGEIWGNKNAREEGGKCAGLKGGRRKRDGPKRTKIPRMTRRTSRSSNAKTNRQRLFRSVGGYSLQAVSIQSIGLVSVLSIESLLCSWAAMHLCPNTRFLRLFGWKIKAPFV